MQIFLPHISMQAWLDDYGATALGDKSEASETVCGSWKMAASFKFNQQSEAPLSFLCGFITDTVLRLRVHKDSISSSLLTGWL